MSFLDLPRSKPRSDRITPRLTDLHHAPDARVLHQKYPSAFQPASGKPTPNSGTRQILQDRTNNDLNTHVRQGAQTPVRRQGNQENIPAVHDTPTLCQAPKNKPVRKELRVKALQRHARVARGQRSAGVSTVFHTSTTTLRANAGQTGGTTDTVSAPDIAPAVPPADRRPKAIARYRVGTDISEFQQALRAGQNLVLLEVTAGEFRLFAADPRLPTVPRWAMQPADRLLAQVCQGIRDSLWPFENRPKPVVWDRCYSLAYRVDYQRARAAHPQQALPMLAEAIEHLMDSTKVQQACSDRNFMPAPPPEDHTQLQSQD